MAKRYELSDEAWAVVADLFTAAHVRGRSRSSDRLMLDVCSGGLLRSSLARYPRALRVLGDGLSPLPSLAKPRNIRSDAQTIAPQTQ